MATVGSGVCQSTHLSLSIAGGATAANHGGIHAPTAHPGHRLGYWLTVALCLLALLPADPARAADLTAGTEAELNAAIAAANAAGAGHTYHHPDGRHHPDRLVNAV